MRHSAFLFAVASLITITTATAQVHRTAHAVLAAADAASPLVWNDNRNPAGVLDGSVLVVSMEIRGGMWYPEGPNGPAKPMLAFAEVGKPAQVPGPLLRVRAGAELRIRLENTLAKPVRIWGLQDRPYTDPDSIDLAPGETREVRFRMTAPGSYYYVGRTTPNTFGAMRGIGDGEDALLTGALIVDPPTSPIPADRVMVINMWADTSNIVLGPLPEEVVVVNGRYWPHTERLMYAVGDTARWRVLNVAFTVHAMHLHGFHFRVDSRGTAAFDSVYTSARQQLAVTDFMPPGSTMSLTWVPRRVGNWLFHCHMTEHMTARTRFSNDSRPEQARHVHAAHRQSGAEDVHGNHAYEGMGGLVVGIDVRPGPGAESDEHARPVRKLRLYAQALPNFFGSDSGYGYLLQEAGASPGWSSARIPGPPIILTRGEPTEITVVNQLPEPTTVHWHGLEIDSYYDGIGDWSGMSGRLAPVIAPGDSFTVRINPVRAGTFIYHSHVEEERQLALGLYGPIIILEPGQTYDPRTDLTFVLGQGGPGSMAPQLLNGTADPEPLELEKGRTYRLRFVSIPTNIPRVISLKAGEELAQWQPLAKDGAYVPEALAVPTTAVQQLNVGETYDFLLTPVEPGTLTLNVEDFAPFLHLPEIRLFMHVR